MQFWKKLKTWQKIAAVVLVLIVVGAVSRRNSPATTANSAGRTEWRSDVPWDSLSAPEKSAFTKAIIGQKACDWPTIEYKLNEMAKSTAKFPEEAEVDGPLLYNGATTISDVQQGLFLTKAQVVGKNAFGVKIRYVAQISWRVDNHCKLSLVGVQAQE